MSAPYYEDDACVIYHGDCREVVDDLDFDVLVTDPPYPGREDLFDTDAVFDVLEAIEPLGFVFWPCTGFVPNEPRLSAVHIWDKTIPIHPRSDIGHPAGHHYERILAFGLGRKCEVFRVPAIMPNFAACVSELTEHPTQKPLDLLRPLVLRTKGTIVDPFMGSGTTLRAAKDLGRKAVGIEIEERYCEIAALRLAQEVFDFAASVPSPEARK